MTHEEIDILWQKAMQESIKDGEMYTRYHFAKLVAEKTLTQRTEQEPVNFEKLAALGWQAMECTICGGGAMGYPQRTEQNFCSRCGKRTQDLTHIHTCTTPKD